ncbi:hypothetical protein CHUAL_007674 [Chamberlinius hualienensis]
MFKGFILLFVIAIVFAQKEEISLKPVKICQLTKNIRPVCGTDGKTYTNVSFLKCAANDKPDLAVKHEGECLTPK